MDLNSLKCSLVLSRLRFMGPTETILSFQYSDLFSFRNFHKSPMLHPILQCHFHTLVSFPHHSFIVSFPHHSFIQCHFHTIHLILMSQLFFYLLSQPILLSVVTTFLLSVVTTFQFNFSSSDLMTIIRIHQRLASLSMAI